MRSQSVGTAQIAPAPPKKTPASRRAGVFFRLPAICLAPTGANWQKVLLLFLSEQSRFRYEAHPERNFKREACAATGCNINGQVCVLPMLELAFGYVKATTMNLSDQQVAGTNPKFTILEAHG